MKKIYKIIVVLIVIVAASGAYYLKSKQGSQETSGAKSNQIATNEKTEQSAAQTATETKNKKLPKLIDLGAGKCIPCKMMAPILEKLKKEYADKFEVEFIDVWINPAEAKKYNIQVIPTQIFYDENGKELFRHIGFFSEEEILKKWQELGVNVAK
ncbi:MAG: thioredoxin family protein [Limisphaerales bacterium]|jgi:thioredoxin 1